MPENCPRKPRLRAQPAIKLGTPPAHAMTRSISSSTLLSGLSAATILLLLGGCAGDSPGAGATGTAGAAGTAASAGTSGGAGTTGAGAVATGTGGAGGRGGSGGGSGTTSGCGKTGAQTGAFQTMITVGGLQRGYYVAIPTPYDANVPHALVFGYHGSNYTG